MKKIEEKAKEYAYEYHEQMFFSGNEYSQYSVKEAFIAGARAVQEWISVDDELPPVGVEVLVKDIIDNHTMFYVCIYDRDFRDFYTNDWEHSLIASKIWRPIEYK